MSINHISVLPMSKSFLYENVGILTPVHIEDISKYQNLEYLQKLCQLVQRTHVTPTWFEYQSAKNKQKFLQIYQISISYAVNTENIYNRKLNEIDQKFQQGQKKFNKLKEDIMRHKAKTQKLKKYHKQLKQLKQKGKFLKYQNNFAKQINKITSRKYQMQKQRLRYTRQLIRNQKIKHFQLTFPIYPFTPPQNPYGHNYDNYSFNYSPPSSHNFPNYLPNQKNPQSPNHRQKQTFQSSQPQQILKMFNIPFNKQKQIKEQTLFDKRTKPPSLFQKEVDKKEIITKQIKQFNDEYNLSFKESKRIETSTKKFKDQNKEQVLENFKPMKDSYVEVLPYSIKTDIQMHKNQTNNQQINNQNSQITNKKQNDFISDADILSMINIQLKTQSYNTQKQEPNTKQDKKIKLNIPDSVNQKTKKIFNVVVEMSDEQQQQVSNRKNNKEILQRKNQEDAQINKKLSIKFSVDNISDDDQGLRDNYLKHSNQGQRVRGRQFLSLNKLKIKDSRIGQSINGISEIDSKKSYKFQCDDNSQNQNSFDSLENILNTKLKAKGFQYMPLFKQMFILKQDVESFVKTSISQCIISKKKSSLQFVAKQKCLKRCQQNDFDMLDSIVMPLYSYVARPSTLKKSTIRKLSINNKKNKQIDSQLKSHKPQTIIKDKLLNKDKQLDDFIKIKNNNNNNLQSKIIEKGYNYKNTNIKKLQQKIPEIPKIPTPIIQSLIFNKLIVQKNQKQSLIQNEYTNSQLHKKIINLIQMKFQQKGIVQFNNNVIITQIQKSINSPYREQLSQEQVISHFNKLSIEKTKQLQKLKQNNRIYKYKIKSQEGQKLGQIVKKSKNQQNIIEKSRIQKIQDMDIVHSLSFQQIQGQILKSKTTKLHSLSFQQIQGQILKSKTTKLKLIQQVQIYNKSINNGKNLSISSQYSNQDKNINIDTLNKSKNMKKGIKDDLNVNNLKDLQKKIKSKQRYVHYEQNDDE